MTSGTLKRKCTRTCNRVRMRLADSRYEMEWMSIAAKSTVA